MSRLKNILIAIDQLANAIFGGWPDETLSSRSWRWHEAGKRTWPKKIIDALFRLFGERDHCYDSWLSEAERRHMPPSLRGDAA